MHVAIRDSNIRFECNQFDPEPHQRKLMSLATTLPEDDKVTEIEIQNATDDDVRLIAPGLADNRSLRKITFRDGRIGNIGANYLAEALAGSQSLEELNLSNNCIGTMGATCLSVRMLEVPNLTIFDLSKNSIGAEALLYFRDMFTGESEDADAAGLKELGCRNLAVFNIANNYISENEATITARFWRNIDRSLDSLPTRKEFGDMVHKYALDWDVPTVDRYYREICKRGTSFLTFAEQQNNAINLHPEMENVDSRIQRYVEEHGQQPSVQQLRTWDATTRGRSYRELKASTYLSKERNSAAKKRVQRNVKRKTNGRRMQQFDVYITARPFNVKFATRDQNRTLVLEKVHKTAAASTPGGKQLIADRDLLRGELRQLKEALKEEKRVIAEAAAENAAGDDAEAEAAPQEEEEEEAQSIESVRLQELAQSIDNVRERLRAVKQEIGYCKGTGKTTRSPPTEEYPDGEPKPLRNGDLVVAVEDRRVYDAKKALKRLNTARLPIKMTILRPARPKNYFSKIQEDLEAQPIQVDVTEGLQIDISNNEIDTPGVAYLIEQFLCVICPDQLNLDGNIFGRKARDLLLSLTGQRVPIAELGIDGQADDPALLKAKGVVRVDGDWALLEGSLAV